MITKDDSYISDKDDILTEILNRNCAPNNISNQDYYDFVDRSEILVGNSPLPGGPWSIVKNGTNYTFGLSNETYPCTGSLIGGLVTDLRHHYDWITSISQESCYANANDIIIEDEEVVFENTVKFIPGDLFIRNGAKVTFKDAGINMVFGGQIIIEDGGKLILDNASTSSCDDLWNGILVESGGSLTCINGTNLKESTSYLIDAKNNSAVYLDDVVFQDSPFGLRMEGHVDLQKYNKVNVIDIDETGLEIVGDASSAINNFPLSAETGEFNLFNNIGGTAIKVNSARVDIENCVFTIVEEAIELKNVINSSIINSNIFGTSMGLKLNKCADIKIINNKIGADGIVKNGIQTLRSSDILIRDNIINAQSYCILNRMSNTKIELNELNVEEFQYWTIGATESIVSSDDISNNFIDLADGIQAVNLLLSSGSHVADNDIECMVSNKVGINIKSGTNYEIENNRVITSDLGIRASSGLSIENSIFNNILCNDLNAEQEDILVKPNSKSQFFRSNFLFGDQAMRLLSEIGIQEDFGNEFFGGEIDATNLLTDEVTKSRFIVNSDYPIEVPVALPNNLVDPSSDNLAEKCDQTEIGPDWIEPLLPPTVVCDIIDRLESIQTTNESKYTINMIHLYQYFIMNKSVSEWPACLSFKWIHNELCGIKELVLAQQTFTDAVYHYNSSALHSYIDTYEDDTESTTLNQLHNQHQLSIDNNLLEAENELINIVCTNELITTWKDVMILFIKYIKEGHFDGSDINTLQQTAQLCPTEYGDAVNWAEAIYTHLTEQEIQNVASCNQEQNLILQIPNNKVLVSPNPSTRLFTIDIPYAYSSMAYSITDNVGRLITRGKDKLTINLENQKAGIYFLHIVIDGEQEISEKIILIR